MAQLLTEKQRKVLSAIDDLTQKNGVVPTLEELRITLGYRKISSVQRHTDALKEKGYLNQDVRGLSIYQAQPINTIFTVRNEQLGLLASQPAVVLFRDLLWAEARRLGIPLDNISISLWTTVPDGGIDAFIEGGNSDIVKTSGIIRAGKTGYQIKTGASFKPWQDTEIKKELFSQKNSTKENLGSSVKSCLDNDGSYVLVCFGQEFTDEQRRNAIQVLSENLKQCGYQSPKVDVWGQSTLASFIHGFPSLALQFQGFDGSGFQTLKSWAQQDDMQKELKAGKKQKDFIEELQAVLRRNDQAIHARVWAEPGAGKTRLVLEAVTTNDLSPLVVYCDTPDQFRESNLMRKIMEDDFLSVLLVLDDCNPDSRSYIWNKLKNLGSRVKVISIYNEYDDTSGSVIYLAAPLLENEQISEIIRGYDIPKDQADRWVELCNGSPRVAHVIGWNLKNNREDILKSPDTVNIWDRYITAGDDPGNPEVQQRKIVLQHIALFKMLGIGKTVVKEAQAIANLTAKVDAQITFPRFLQITKKLRQRKILQGETTLYITPKALHIQMWKYWWDTYGEGFDFGDFSSKIPDSLKEWFYEMFRYAATSDAAGAIVEDLLGENGPFQSGGYLETKLGSDFFLALTEANPEAALKCLQNTIGRWGKEKLYQIKEPRQNFVRSLERIAVWKNLFPDATRLLLVLAEAENDTIYSNNASGTFTGLFSPGPGGVAPTEASPEERLPVLAEALNSNSKERRLLAIQACDKGLEANHFARVVGPEYQGLKSANLWRPKNRDEMISAYRRVWDLLFSKIDNLSEDEQKKAVEVLLNNARSLTPAPELADIIVPNVTALSTKPFVDKKDILETVESILHYAKKELPSQIAIQWGALRDSLVGSDFSSLMQRYVGMDLLEDKFDDDGKRVDKVESQIDALVQQVITKPEIIVPELSWLVTDEAKSGYRFAYKLGQNDKEFSLLFVLLNAQRAVINNDKASDYFLGGYLKAMFERNPERWEALMDELAEDGDLASWVSAFTWRSGVSNQSALRILKLAKKGVLRPYHFRVFGLGSVIINLSDEVFRQWMEFLLKSSEDYAASIALDLHHFFYIRKDATHTLPGELTLKLLTHPSLFKRHKEGRRDQMDDFHWQEIADKFIDLYPEDEIALLDVALEHFGEEGTVLEGYRSHALSTINAIARKHPSETWDQVTKYLGPPIDSRAYHIKEWLKGKSFFEEKEGTLANFTPDKVWKWVDKDVEKRAVYLASFVPKFLFKTEGRICWARELLVKYGSREDVQNTLMANFSTEGWSGPASLHYQQKRDGLLAFKEQEENENVKRWIDRFVVGLNRQIENERIVEERRGF